MASSDDPAEVERPAYLAIVRVVRLLSEVRLAVVALSIASAWARGAVHPATWLVVALAVPFSFVPAWSWERRGARLSTSGLLLAAELVVTSLVVGFLGGELAFVYAAATAALLGAIVGVRLSSIMAVPIAAALAADVWTGSPGSWAVVGAEVLGIAAMVLAGNTLGTSLRSQDAVARELGLARTRRAATSERVRIARDLHDTVAGDLAGAMMLGRMLAVRLDRAASDERTRELADQLVDAVETAHRHTRAALSELRRAEATTGEALVGLAERWSVRTGIRVDVDADLAVGVMEPELAGDLESILLELLENVRKHSGASCASVRLDRSGAAVRLVVEDDGRGMADTTPRDGHYGLPGIVERAQARGGSVVRGESSTGGLSTEVLLPTAQEVGIA